MVYLDLAVIKEQSGNNKSENSRLVIELALF